MTDRPPLLKGPTKKQLKSQRDRENKRRMIEWHNIVVDRAGGKCEVCKRSYPRNMLCGHHIETRGARPDLKYDPDNGLCVCLNCHHLIHSGEVTFGERLTEDELGFGFIPMTTTKEAFENLDNISIPRDLPKGHFS